MATTFLGYKGSKGFYIHETYAKLIFQFIYQELKKAKYTFVNKDILLADCEAKINGWRNGYIVLRWDDRLIGMDEENNMTQLLQNIIIDLQTRGNYISVEELQAIPSEDELWKMDLDKKFPVNELIRVFNALIQMLQGTWLSTNYDMNIKWK
ncbi:hypothetical protein CA265_06000 [Sphingobacteriaceae bacterium GW460-11-11-14-LB5]|nr:hypothetical protein CA265_06000 [Sphingobacteriaceae bacterium GW460-11-11-14-LB5]